MKEKYLDKEDIESFGFESRMIRLPEGEGCEYLTKEYHSERSDLNYIHVFINKRNNHVMLVVSFSEDPANGKTIFAGNIRNKTEFGKILKMVNN